MLRLQLAFACGLLRAAASELSDSAKTGSDKADFSEGLLDQNDECASDASGNSCALNALQHRGAIEEVPEETEDPGMLTCDPVCKTQTVTNDYLPEPTETKEGDGEDELGASMGSSYIRHYAQDCWRRCGHSGWCPNYCGEGNACCRWGFKGKDPAECAHVHFWPILHAHTCVHPQVHHSSAPTLSPAVSPSTPVSNAAGLDGTNIQTMYQMTSPANAKSILGSKLHAGSVGWCGGAIYVMNKPLLQHSKFNPKTTTTGAWLAIEIDMGKMCRMSRPPRCNDGATGYCCKGPDQEVHYGTKGAAAAGCNSIVFNPGDGDEWNIWDASQIKSKKLHSCTTPECAQLFPGFSR